LAAIVFSAKKLSLINHLSFNFGDIMIPEKIFGRTGHKSKRVIFGAVAFLEATQAEADATMEILLEHGINHIDAAASYGNAELRLGPWIKKHRDKFFLATKTEERSYSKAKAELEQSLERLQTDHVDLWQIHALVDPAEWEIAMGPNGALEAFIEAREKGLVKYLGVTSHGVVAPSILLRSLERFDFDAVLLPYNYLMMQNPQYTAGFNRLSHICNQRNVAVQTTKALARGRLENQEKVRTVWYDPIENETAIEHSVHWVLGNPAVFLNSVGDAYLLPKVLEAAGRFQQRPADEVMQQDVKEKSMTPLFTEQSEP
jgi:predicted aldo/keto reductase-like oxidoreductase